MLAATNSLSSNTSRARYRVRPSWSGEVTTSSGQNSWASKSFRFSL